MWIAGPFRDFLRATTHVGLTRDDVGEYLIFLTRSVEKNSFTFEVNARQSFGIWADLIPTRNGVLLVHFVVRLQRLFRRRIQARAKALAWAMSGHERLGVDALALSDDLRRVIIGMIL
jgi:hypothetical protein